MFFGSKKEVVPEIYTEETCTSCKALTKRQFADGDYVYKGTGLTCSKCSSTEVFISGIYGEYPPDPQKDKE